MEQAENASHTKIAALGIARADYQIVFRIYGKNGVMGAMEPLQNQVSHELGILAEVIAVSQEIANAALALVRVTLLHSDFPGRLCREGNMAFPFSPSDMERGPSYEFSMNHVLEISDPLKLFPITYEDV